jgi:hypothetical protein
MPYKFEVYKDEKGEYRFRFKAPNGRNVFSGEGYKQRQSAIKTIESIKKNVLKAEIVDQT